MTAYYNKNKAEHQQARHLVQMRTVDGTPLRVTPGDRVTSNFAPFWETGSDWRLSPSTSRRPRACGRLPFI